MFIYLILLIIISLLLMSRHTFLYKYKNIIIIFVFIILFLVCILRSPFVGTDYYQYFNMFKNFTYKDLINIYGITGVMEPGYLRLTEIAQIMNNFLLIPATVFIIGFISIYLLGIRFHINRFTLISFFVISGLYFQMFTALRQMIALGIVYIGLYLLFSKRNINLFNVILFLICVYIALEFHKTSIFAILFLLFPYIRYGRITVVISGILTILLLLSGLGQHISYWIINITPHYSEKYMGASMVSGHSSIKLIIESFSIILQFVFLYQFVSKNKVKDKKEQFILSGYLFYLILFIGLDNSIIRRLQLYTLIFPILYSGLFLDFNSKLKIHVKRSDKIMYVLFWILLYIGKLVITDRFKIVPYQIINLSNVSYK